MSPKVSPWLLLLLAGSCSPGPGYTAMGGGLPPISRFTGDAGTASNHDAGRADAAEMGTDGAVSSVTDGGSGDGGEANDDAGEGDGGDAGPVDAGLADAGADAGTLPTQPCGNSDADGKDSSAALVVSEIYFDAPEFVEFYNHGSAATNLNMFTYGGAIEGQTVSGSISGGQYTLVTSNLSPLSGDLAIFQQGTMIFYVCWGSLGSDPLEMTAAGQSLWLSASCVPAPSAGQSLHLTGPGIAAGDWTAGPPTPLGCSLGH